MEWKPPVNNLDPRDSAEEFLQENLGDQTLCDLPPNIETMLESVSAHKGAKFIPQRKREDSVVESVPAFIDEWPSADRLGVQYGGGDWRIHVEYFPKTWDLSKNKKPQVLDSDWFHLSEDAYEPLHYAYREKQRARRLRNIREKSEEDSARGFGDPMQMVQTILSAARSIAPQQGSGMDVSLIIQMMNQNNQQFQAMMAEQSKMTMLLFQSLMSSKSEDTKTLVSLMAGRNNDSADKMMDRAFTFLTGAMQTKQRFERLQSGEDADMSSENEEKGFLAQAWEVLTQQILPNLKYLRMMPENTARQAVEEKVEEAGGMEMLEQARQILANNQEQRVYYLMNAVTTCKGDVKAAHALLSSVGIDHDIAELEAAKTQSQSEEG